MTEVSNIPDGCRILRTQIIFLHPYIYFPVFLLSMSEALAARIRSPRSFFTSLPLPTYSDFRRSRSAFPADCRNFFRKTIRSLMDTNRRCNSRLTWLFWRFWTSLLQQTMELIILWRPWSSWPYRPVFHLSWVIRQCSFRRSISATVGWFFTTLLTYRRYWTRYIFIEILTLCLPFLARRTCRCVLYLIDRSLPKLVLYLRIAEIWSIFFISRDFSFIPFWTEDVELHFFSLTILFTDVHTRKASVLIQDHEGRNVTGGCLLPLLLFAWEIGGCSSVKLEANCGSFSEKSSSFAQLAQLITSILKPT